MSPRGQLQAYVQASTIVGSLVAFIVAIALNAYYNIPGVSPFNATIANVSDKYDTGLTPAGAAFGIWGLIYLWLLTITIYCQTLICRSSDGKPLYLDPGFIPSAFFISFIISILGNPLWIVTFLSELLLEASCILVLGVLMNVIAFWSSVSGLDRCGAEMTRRGLIPDIWLTRFIVHNGMALYLGWVCCATLIQLVTFAVYRNSVTMEMACTVALATLAALLVGWFVLETFIADRKLRYVFGQYIAFLTALSGGYVKNYDPSILYTKLSLALLIVTSVFAAVKLVIIIVRSVKDPIHYKPTVSE